MRTELAVMPAQEGFCISFVHVVLSHVSAQGGDNALVLAALGDSAQALQVNVNQRVTAAQLSMILNAACTSLNDEHVGLRIGMGMQHVRLGAFGYAAMTAPNGISAVQLYEELQQLLLTEIVMRHEIKGSLLHVHIEGSRRLPNDYAFWSFLMASRLSCLRGVCAQHVVPDRVTLPCPPPRCQQALHAFVGVPVQFNAKDYSERVPYGPLTAPNPQSSPEIHHVMATLARREWKEAFDRDDALMAQLKAGILRALEKGANPTLRSLAPQLAPTQNGGQAIGVRQLQRQLAVHRCTFRTLVEEVRQERVLAQLRLTDRPLADIAAEAGYAELSSFHRAVRRWTGMTPMHIRKEGEARGSSLVKF